MSKIVTKKSKKIYDLIVVPGLKFGPRFAMRRDMQKRLTLAAHIYKEHSGIHIAVCGKWSIWYDWLGITPPVTESHQMKGYLVKHGVLAKDILMESHSKDTPGNIYYLKLLIENKTKYKRLLVICAKQHKKRLRFIFDTFFGPSYHIDFMPVVSTHFMANVTGHEQKCLDEQKLLLAGIRQGHARDFRHRLYNSTYYTSQAKAVKLI